MRSGLAATVTTPALTPTRGGEKMIDPMIDKPLRDIIADIIFPFRWFFSNNRDDALDLADQIIAKLKQLQ